MSDYQSDTSSDSIYDDDIETSIAQDDHVMEPEMEESSARKKRNREQLEHSHDGRTSQRPRSRELIKLLKELTNCNKTDNLDIMDDVADYIRAMTVQLEMIKATANWMQTVSMGMYYGMPWPQPQPQGVMIPPSQYSFNPYLPETYTSIGPSESYTSGSTSTDQNKGNNPSGNHTIP